MSKTRGAASNGNELIYNNKNVILKCIDCGKTYAPNPLLIKCKKCNGLLEVIIEFNGGISWKKFKRRKSTMWRYIDLLPVPNNVKIISLCEGNTPLVRAEYLEEQLGIKRVYIKFEGANPTGSFKDRGMSLAISLAKHININTFIVASTGNTSASAAAYVAKAGGKCIVLIPHDKIALGKLAQAMLHGAYILEIKGSFDDALSKVQKAIDIDKSLYPLNSINPWRLEGQKTISYEIVEDLGSSPDWIVVPVGNAGNIYAIGKGMMELNSVGLIDYLPKIAGVQALGAAPLTRTWKCGSPELLSISNPETIATAIRIGKPVNWKKAIKIVKYLRGTFTEVSDTEIVNAQKILARHVGIGGEPAGAASIAGLKTLVDSGVISHNDSVVCIVTGHALKDPQVILGRETSKRMIIELDDVIKYIARIAGDA